MKNKFWGWFAVLLLVVSFLPACTPGAVKAPPNIKPIIFVHGYAGSAAQFESQAVRFETNGYPASYISAYEYDSAAGLSPQFPPAAVLDGVDQVVDAVLKDTGADKVDLIGHSLGTRVSQAYLKSSPERAAKVAHYVNVDGQAGADLPGGVPTLALWAGRRPPAFPPGGEIVGATNVTFPNVTHVECATCPEAFVEMYKFLAGQAPVTDKIVTEPSGKIELAGRAVIFPQNIGVQQPGATLQIWEVDAKTGARTGSQPQATYPIGGTGAWGPFDARSSVNYEFCLLQETIMTHYYFQPFIRSDYLIRLNTEIPGKGLSSHADTSERQSNMLIMRNKELWGDQGADSDVLTINGSNIVTPAICPLNKLVIAIFVNDNGADGKSDLTAPIPYFFSAVSFFISGADLYIPAANPPNGTIPLVLTPRGGGGHTQVINVPNWVSLKDRIFVQFNDFIQAD
ncbi:MAG: alpha/beta fold hydrolase [Dehalococcoidia bacterium]